MKTNTNSLSTTSKTIRFPDSIINRVEKSITNEDRDFSDFVVDAVKKALQNIKEG